MKSMLLKRLLNILFLHRGITDFTFPISIFCFFLHSRSPKASKVISPIPSSSTPAAYPYTPSLVQACSLNQNVRFIRKLANLKNILVSICRSPYALNCISHNNQHTMPFLFGKLRYCLQISSSDVFQSMGVNSSSASDAA